MVLVLFYEVVARYVFTRPTIWAHETSTMLSVVLITMGWAYVQRYNKHIRIDLIYSRHSPRGKAITDVIFTSILLFPFFIAVINSAAKGVADSLLTHEVGIMSFWHPPMFPIRIFFLLGVSLFTLQSIASYIRDWYLIIRRKPLD